MATSSFTTAKTSGGNTPNAARRMLESLAENPNRVIALFGLYFLIQIFVRMAMPPALRIDEAQQVLFAQWRALGYDAQPPLYNWYQQAIFYLFGTSVMTIALAKNLVLFLTFALYIKIADLVLRDKRLVLAAAFGLFFIPQVFWQAQRDLTHTTMLMLTFMWVAYLSVRLIRNPTTMGYLLIGIAVGLGMLSKYNFVLILPALLVAVWLHPQGRERILDRRFILTIGISLIVFLPHAFWLLQNFQFASDVTLQRMAEEAPQSRLLQILLGLGRVVFGAAIIIAIPSLIAAISGWRSTAFPNRSVENAEWFRFFLHYFATLLLLLVIVILSTTMTEVRDRWLLPLFMPFPILAALWLEQRQVDHARIQRKALPIAIGVMALLPVILVVSIPLQAMAGAASRSNSNWESFANYIKDERKLSPSVIVTPDWHTGGNLRFVFQDIPVATIIYDDFDPAFQPSYDHPILIVWTGDGNLDNNIALWLEEQLKQPLSNVVVNRFEAPMYFPVEGKLQQFSYAVVTPDNFNDSQINKVDK